MAAPEGSVTVPESVAPDTCANEMLAENWMSVAITSTLKVAGIRRGIRCGMAPLLAISPQSPGLTLRTTHWLYSLRPTQTCPKTHPSSGHWGFGRGVTYITGY